MKKKFFSKITIWIQQYRKNSKTVIHFLEGERKKKCTQIPLVKRASTKQLLILDAPNILTIHLKRFYITNSGQGVKISTYISFPLQLDITPYIKPTEYSKNEISNGTKKMNIYNLYGVCNHSGGLNGGHYTAYSRLKQKDGSRGDWHFISDGNWYPVSTAEVLNSSAYILFYELAE